MDVVVELFGTLAARTGIHDARVGVPEGATVADVVEAVADRFGPQATSAVLEGERLRADTVVVRVDGNTTLTASSPVVAGDSVRIELAG